MKAIGQGMQEVWREQEKAMPCLVGTDRGTTRRWNGGGHGAVRMRVVASLAHQPWRSGHARHVRAARARVVGKGQRDGQHNRRREEEGPAAAEEQRQRKLCCSAIARERQRARGRRRMERAKGVGLFT
jgi:hypothetical protein